MASTQLSPTTASTSANTCRLTLSSSKTASMTKSASAKASLLTEPLISAFCRLAASAEIRPRAACLSISACTCPTPNSTRAWSRSVITTGTCRRRTNSSAIWAAIRPAPTTPTLVDRPGQRLIRGARGAPGAPLHQVERVQPGPQLLRQQQVGQGVVLGREALVAGGGPRRRDQVDGQDRRGRGPVQLAVGQEPGGADRLRPLLLGSGGGRVRTCRPLQGHRAVQHRRRPAQRLLEEVGGLEHRVGDPEGERLGAADHLVLGEGVLDDELERGGRADQPGQQVGTAPAGHQAERALGEGDHRHAGRDRPVGAVQRDLQAAAEGDPVDEAERGHGQLAEAPEHRVAERGDAQRPLAGEGRVHARGGDGRGGGVQVRAGGQDERLAGDADGSDLACRGPRRHGVQGRVQ